MRSHNKLLLPNRPSVKRSLFATLPNQWVAAAHSSHVINFHCTFQLTLRALFLPPIDSHDLRFTYARRSPTSSILRYPTDVSTLTWTDWHWRLFGGRWCWWLSLVAVAACDKSFEREREREKVASRALITVYSMRVARRRHIIHELSIEQRFSNDLFSSFITDLYCLLQCDGVESINYEWISARSRCRQRLYHVIIVVTNTLIVLVPTGALVTLPLVVDKQSARVFTEPWR